MLEYYYVNVVQVTHDDEPVPYFLWSNYRKTKVYIYIYICMWVYGIEYNGGLLCMQKIKAIRPLL